MMWFMVEELSILNAVSFADIFVMLFVHDIFQCSFQGGPKKKTPFYFKSIQSQAKVKTGVKSYTAL